MKPKTRNYEELSQLTTLEERYRYLRVHSSVGIETFGFERWLNQAFYTSVQWKQARQEVIARDRGCDLGIEGYEIFDHVIVHHMNPMEVADVTHGDPTILNPDYLICTTLRTHNAIHYGDESLLARPPVRRRPGDTKLWLGETSMTRIMGDSSTFGDVPSHVDIVAAYANGSFGVATEQQLEAKYPNARYGHVLVDVNGSRPDAQARDWENGDKGGSLEKWVADHNKAAGREDAVVYCNGSTIPEVRGLTGAMVLGKDYYLWVATLDGSEHTGPGIIACQNKGAKLTGGHWDSSVVYDDRFWKATGGAPAKPSIKPDCSPLQHAVRTTVDGIWGKETDRHAYGAIEASNGVFPYGVEFAQTVIGAQPDGLWGPISRTALKDTIAEMQRALKTMGFDPQTVDGVWGQHTTIAYITARNACTK